MSDYLALVSKADRLLEAVKALDINNDADYKEADQFISESVAGEKMIKENLAEEKAEAKRVYDEVRAREKQPLSIFEQVVSIVTGKMSVFREERERIEQERRDNAQKKQEEGMLLQAQEMAEDGVPQEVIDQCTELAMRPVAIRTEELRSKTTFGVTYRVEFEVGQERLIPLEILIPTTKGHRDAVLAKAKKLAILTGGEPIPGLRVIQEESVRRKSA